jgi:hypothetical protein
MKYKLPKDIMKKLKDKSVLDTPITDGVFAGLTYGQSLEILSENPGANENKLLSIVKKRKKGKGGDK